MSTKTTVCFCPWSSERKCKGLIPPWHVCAGTASSRDTIWLAIFFFQLTVLIYSAQSINTASKSGTLPVLWAHLTAQKSLHCMFLYSTSDEDAHTQAKGSKERINFAQTVIAEQGWSELEIIEYSWEHWPGALTTKAPGPGRAGRRRQQSQEWRKEKEKWCGFHRKRLGRMSCADQAMLTDCV